MKVTVQLACFASLLLPHMASAQGQLGVPRFIDRATSGVAALTTTDLDGDGDDDLVYWDWSGRIDWRESRGDGRVSMARPAGPTFPSPFGPFNLLTFDADGDGREDLFASSRFQGLAVALNEGGRFSSPTVIAPLAPVSVAVGPLDMDGDGRLDLVTRTEAAEGLLWQRNLGGGNFDTPTPVWNAGADVVDATLTDLDGDGDIDIVAITDGFPVRVVAAVNIGVPGDMRQLAVGELDQSSGSAYSVETADTDGDGLPEIFGIASSRTSLIDNLTGVTFAPPTFDTGPATISGSDGILFDDVDGDGDQDIFGFARTRWSINDGTGSFSAEPQLFTIDRVFEAAKGDMDGDGRDDIAFALNSFRQSGWLRNDGTGTPPFTKPTVLYQRRLTVWDVEPLDADGDGDTDLAVLSSGSDEIQLYENVAGKAVARTSSPIGDQVYRAVSGDVNGDGFEDLVTDGFQAVRVWLGSRNGLFTAAPPLLGAMQSNAYAAAPVDVDGDGILDLVTSTDNGNVSGECSVQWRAGLGDGSFGAPNLVTAPFVRALNEIRTADVDGDGRPDIVGSTWQQELRAWRNLGGGTFVPLTLVPATASVEDYALGDFDGDGDLDVAVSGRPAGPGVIELYETTPGGPVGPTATAPIIAETGIHTGDVNGDGTPDVLLQVRPSIFAFLQRNFVALLVGPGLTMSAPVLLAGPLDDERAWSPMDWEGDGDVDIAWGNQDTMQVGIMLEPRLGEVGDGFCNAVPNSTGRRGRTDALGSTSAASGQLRLRASQLPPQQTTLFLSGEGRADVFPVSNSVGRLCLGGSLGRFLGPGQVRESGPGGQVILDLDLGALPRGSQTLPAAAGTTWTFQAWHRDSGPTGSSSNFTEAVELLFTP